MEREWWPGSGLGPRTVKVRSSKLGTNLKDAESSFCLEPQHSAG